MTNDSNSSQIDVNSENLEPPSWTDGLREYAAAVLRELSISQWELSFLITDDTMVQSLNSTYREKDEPTDVLSFSAVGSTVDGQRDSSVVAGDVFHAGDIVLNLPMIERQAKDWSVTPEEELRRLVIHGILHLAGHTHTSNDLTEEPMLRLQETLLEKIKERIY